MNRIAFAAVISLFASFSLGVLSLSAAPTRQPEDSHITVGGKQIAVSKTCAENIQKLQKSGLAIFCPTNYPARFSLTEVKIDKTDAHDPRLDYELKFTDKKHHEIAVETAYWGIGDGPDGDRIVNGKSKALGKFSLNIFKPGSEGNGTKEVYYLSDWITYDPAKTAKSASSQKRFYHFLGTGLTDKEAMAIGESMELVSK